jgi:hypothetical protein
VSGFSRTIEQPDRSIERRRTQVHVALRRVEILVSGQFLDCTRWRATHCQMRTERVPHYAAHGISGIMPMTGLCRLASDTSQIEAAIEHF